MSSASRDSPREAFTHSFLHNPGLASPGFESARQPAIFNERGFDDVALSSVGVGGVGSPLRETFGGPSQLLGIGMPGSQEVAQMFDSFTNQDDDDSQKMKGVELGGIGSGVGVGGSGVGTAGKKEEREAKWGGDDDIDMFFDAP